MRLAGAVAILIGSQVAIPAPGHATGNAVLEIALSVGTAQPVAAGSPITFYLSYACSSLDAQYCTDVHIDIPRPTGQPGNIPLTIAGTFSDPTGIHYANPAFPSGTSTQVDFTITAPPGTPDGTTVTPVATSTASNAPTRTVSATATVGGTNLGQLRVTSSPALPSQILVDGIPRDTWGLAWLPLPPGSYTVGFTHVEGWTEPAPATVTVSTGAVTTVTGTFTQRGVLRVTTNPAVPGTITVDAIPRNAWGMWTDLPAGAHQVCFGPVPGFTAPACTYASLAPGVLSTVVGNYT